MTVSLKVAVSSLIGLPESTIEDWAKDAPRTYRRYEVDKRAGGKRVIFHPSKSTKALQYAILSLVEKSLYKNRVHACAMAYRRGFSSPLRNNAVLHSVNPYLIRADLRDFFPSISVTMVVQSLPWQMSNEDQEFFLKCCFVKNGQGIYGLPIGAPSSPLLSNCAMYAFDADVHNLAQSLNGCYTRYADDIVFSCKNSNDRGIWLSGISERLNVMSGGVLRINEDKTRFGSRAAKRSVTGVIITPQGGISIGRDRKREIRAMIHKASFGALGLDQIERLRGLLAFASDIEPQFLERMISRYGEVVLKIRRGVYKE